MQDESFKADLLCSRFLLHMWCRKHLVELTNLKGAFFKMDSNVSAFNINLKLKIKRLNQLGQTESQQDLLLQLFEAYSNAQDEDFAKYIDSCKAEHNDRRNVVTYKQLMALALQKFKLMKCQGKWKAPTLTEKRSWPFRLSSRQWSPRLKTIRRKFHY